LPKNKGGDGREQRVNRLRKAVVLEEGGWHVLVAHSPPHHFLHILAGRATVSRVGQTGKVRCTLQRSRGFWTFNFVQTVSSHIIRRGAHAAAVHARAVKTQRRMPTHACWLAGRHRARMTQRAPTGMTTETSHLCKELRPVMPFASHWAPLVAWRSQVNSVGILQLHRRFKAGHSPAQTY
jgi:hypothetical protein